MDGMESWTGKLTGVESDSTASGTPFQRGDVLFGKLRPYLAKSWLADESGTAQGDIHVYRPHAGTHPEYLAYIIRSREFVRFANAASEGVKMPRVEWPKLRSYDIPLPDLPTQRRIADYLDRETAQIDAMARALDGLVARLEERRRAQIEDALISNPLTPITSAAHALNTLAGYAFPSDLFTESSVNGHRLLRGVNISPTGIHWANTVHSVTSAQVAETYSLRAGDVVLGMDRPFISGGTRVARITESEAGSLLVQRVLRIRDSDNLLADYFYYTLKSQGFRDYMEPEFTGVSVPHLSESQVSRFRIPLPPLDEQRRIADHLDAETAKIDAMIAKAGELRALLDERRSALITATVTGQHPVPEEP